MEVGKGFWKSLSKGVWMQETSRERLARDVQAWLPGHEGNWTWVEGGQETPSPPVGQPVYILSAHMAFSRLLAQLPHTLSLSTPSLFPAAPTEGHCCLPWLRPRPGMGRAPGETREPRGLTAL